LGLEYKKQMARFLSDYGCQSAVSVYNDFDAHVIWFYSVG